MDPCPCFVYVRVCCSLSLLECSVLTWHPAGEVPVTCLRGRYSPSQGGGQISPGHWDRLRVNCRHVFGNMVRFWEQMGPGRALRGPGVSFSACLGHFWANLASWSLFGLDNFWGQMGPGRAQSGPEVCIIVVAIFARPLCQNSSTGSPCCRGSNQR